MAIKLKIPRAKAPARGGRSSSHSLVSRFSLSDPVTRVASAFFLVVTLVVLGVFVGYYVKYERIIVRRLHGQIFTNATKIYARPASVWVGEGITAEEIANQLRRAGYIDADQSSGVGSYRLLARGIEIHPGPESYHNQDGAVVRESGGKIERIVGTGGANGRDLSAYELEPTMITAVDTEQRFKRQLLV